MKFKFKNFKISQIYKWAINIFLELFGQEKNQFAIVSLSIFSTLLSRITLFVPSIRLVVIISINFFSLIVSVLYILLTDHSFKRDILKRLKERKKIFIGLLIPYLIVELLNFNDIQYLKLPTLFVFNTFTLLVVLSTFISKDNIINFLTYISKIYFFLLYYSVLFAVLVIILPNRIVWMNKTKYLVTDYFFDISLRQHIIGRGITARYSSIFTNVNHFAEFAYMATIFTIIMKEYKKSFYYYVNIMCVIFILMLTKSRNSILTISVLFFCHYIIKNKHKLNKRTILVVISLMIILLLPIAKLRPVDDVSNGRFKLWKIALDNFIKRPFIGYGTSNFRDIISIHAANTHNSFLQLMGSGGLIYLITYLGFIYKYITNNIKLTRSKYNENMILGNNLISFLISSIVLQMFSTRILEIHHHFSMLIFFEYISSQLMYDS